MSAEGIKRLQAALATYTPAAPHLTAVPDEGDEDQGDEDGQQHD